MKRVSVFTRTIVAGVIALSVSASLGAVQAIQPQGSHPPLEAMEQHWQSVIKEHDTARRQVLIEEHRRMMNEAQKTDKDKTVPVRPSEMGAMKQDPAHRDIRNTIEVHSIMLDMMK